MKVKTTGSNKLPHAWVVSPEDKGRRKIYDDNKIYIDKKEEFEIELYNPTKNNVVTLINLDGRAISKTGLLIRPGERFYLDCFIDDKKKFVFDTYNVEDTDVSTSAILKNGVLEIFFYNEKIAERVDLTKVNEYHHHHYWPNIYQRPYIQQSPYTPNPIWYGTTQTCNTYYNNSGNVGDNIRTFGIDAKAELHKMLETGTIIGGEKSEQQFNEIDTCLVEEHISNVAYTLLPNSRKPKTSKDIQKTNMERISDKLSEGDCIDSLIDRLHNFNSLQVEKLIESSEFDLIKLKTTKSIIELSAIIDIKHIDDLANYIMSLGNLMTENLITEEEFKLIKTNLFNSIK